MLYTAPLLSNILMYFTILDEKGNRLKDGLTHEHTSLNVIIDKVHQYKTQL